MDAASPNSSSGSKDDEPLSDMSDEAVPRTTKILAAASAAAKEDGPFITSSSSSELC